MDRFLVSVCAACGRGGRKIVRHWDQSRGATNPPECARLWYRMGHRDDDIGPGLKPVAQCMIYQHLGRHWVIPYNFRSTLNAGRHELAGKKF
jgi:hypothetical protein